MIATDIGVRIQFRHDREPHAEDLRGERFQVITTCYLVDENDNDIGIGRAFCVAEDQFRKELGRRIALTRALSDTDLDKSARRSIWDAYFGR